MSTRVPVPRWAVSVAIGIGVGFLYFAATLLLSRSGWYSKEATSVSYWLGALGEVMGDFPFGYWVFESRIGYVLNGLLWGTLGACLFALHVRITGRRQPNASPNGGPAIRFGNSGVGGGPPSVS